MGDKQESPELTSVSLGEDYPFPIVEHSFARERCLETYKRARSEEPNSQFLCILDIPHLYGTPCFYTVLIILVLRIS
ncbi:MAG: hypothetical protein CM15mP49_07930 [Actinomycetota bacterium]|nr:MAG: hypothetical protein CM15mP49_07930 [Actinomycetota bacterium]